MKEKLIMLRNTLLLIDTRGESTVHMADCIKFVSQLISEYEEKEKNTSVESYEL